MRFAVSAIVLGLSAALALDPPHNIDCANCHQTHNSPGATLGSVAGNANLCQSCHSPGGTASNYPLANSDQALPGLGLPPGTGGSGTSHRWDSGVAGHVQFLGGAPVSSTGSLISQGAYTGVYPKTYSITILTAGAAGTATFNWSATSPGGGSGANLSTGTNVLLDQGVSIKFVGGLPTSFQAGDVWNIYVRPNLVSPSSAAVAARLDNGAMTCSACHDPHSQAMTPFDTNAPTYSSAGTGNGRHFMRVDNNLNQLCIDCHVAYYATNNPAASHPVAVSVPADRLHKNPASLVLQTNGQVGCLTCHDTHRSVSADGSLLRTTNSAALCLDCHIIPTASLAAHLSSTNANTIWPGGKYGSLMPARIGAAQSGACANCHPVHGWPNATNTAARYPNLLADQGKNLCFTCHDATGPAVKKVQADFSKARRHPVGINDPFSRPGRSVECVDCHDPHQAQAGSRDYNATATASRNASSNAPSLAAVSGVAIDYSGMANFQSVASNRFSLIASSTSIAFEYQLCIKCHSSYSFGTTAPPGITPVYAAGTATFTSGSATITGSGTSWNAGMAGLWICTAADPSKVFRIAAVASATSLTLATPYSGPSASAQAYSMSGGSDVAQEFSPMNNSGHPIVTGLDNYPNSTPVGGKKGLLAAAMKAPWNVNVGQQTMMCSDCHTTDAASPAAQGPHGSAAQFMLRGPNAANWPNVQNSAWNTSWCANCHNNSSGTYHGGDHSGNRCYECHIVIPHGGKVSRLLAANNGGSIPARYAYNNNVSSIRLTGFTKTSATGYREANCGCTSHHGTANGTERW